MAKRKVHEIKNREAVEKRREKIQQLQQNQSPEFDDKQLFPSIAEKILDVQQTYGNRYVQRLAEGNGNTLLNKDIVHRIEQQKGSGAYLEPERCLEMETAFNHDFSGVRIHTDPEANNLSLDLKAKAFTTGKDIFFRANSYDPNSENGRKILSHELTHVVQQSNSSPGPPTAVSQPNEAIEVEAESVAAKSVEPGEIHQSVSENILSRGDETTVDPDADYVIRIGDRQYRCSRTDLPTELPRYFVILRNRCENGREAVQRYIDRERWRPESYVSDWAAGVTRPDPSMYDRTDRLLADAEAAFFAGDYEESFDILEEASQACRDCDNTYHRYVQGSIGGAEESVEVLETTSATAITVAATVGTAGLAPGAGLLAGAGITAGLAVAGTVITEGMRELFEALGGVDEEFNWERFITRVTVAGATNFIAALTAGALRNVFSGQVSRVLIEREPVRVAINELLEIEGMAPLADTTLRAWVRGNLNVVVRVVSQLPASVLSGALSATVEAIRERPPENERDLIDIFVENIFTEGWGNIAGELALIFMGS